MDEFVQLGWAKYFGNGLFETIWPAKAIGYAIFYKLAHLIGWDAQSILLAGRMQTALLACATLAIVYACARALGEDRLRALIIVLILLTFSNFIERIFRTISEPLAVFFAAAALLVILRGKADRALTVIAAGILSGLAFLATQKSVYFNVALGLALVGNAALARQYAAGVMRGAWLMLGWLIPIAAYCFIFGGSDPVPVANNLMFGPVEVATHGADPYGGLRNFVVQTLSRNIILYVFCFAGMVLSLLRIRSLEGRRRIALIFSVVITVLVFTHDQPWPYVFVMALPFMSLWSLTLIDRLAAHTHYLGVACVVLGIAVAASFVKNLLYLRHDNADQLELVARAEALIGSNELYFDGVGMVPNRMEPSILWLGRGEILKTLREGENSEAYRILANSPPKIIISSYRTDAILPVVGPLVEKSYVKIGPNLLVAGQRLLPTNPKRFHVPIPGPYVLYTASGELVNRQVEINGITKVPPFYLSFGQAKLMLRDGTTEVFLLPAGLPPTAFEPGASDVPLFKGVYD